MIVFFNFNGRAGGGGIIGPLVLMLPILLSFGGRAFDFVDEAFEWLAWRAAPYIGRERSGLLFGTLLDVVLLAATLLVGIALVRWTHGQWRQGGWWGMLKSLASALAFGVPVAGWGRQPAQQQRQEQQRSHKERWERVAEAIQRLPAESVASRADLEGLPGQELRRRAAAAGVLAAGALEKRELVAALLEAGGTSGETCTICCEDYAPGDVVRLLPRCKHRFHVECIDRWLLSSTDYSRPPACPNCNAPLLEGEGPPAASAGGGGQGTQRAPQQQQRA